MRAKEGARGSENVRVSEATPIEGDDSFPTDFSAGNYDLLVRDDVELSKVVEEREEENIEDKDSRVERGGAEDGSERAETGKKFLPGTLEDVHSGDVAAD